MNEKPLTEYFKTPDTPFGINEWNEIAPNTNFSFIFMTARSGSTYIDSLLHHMGDIGRPREYLNGDWVHQLPRDNLCFKKYLKELNEKHSRNNVFSIKSEFNRLSEFFKEKLLDPNFFSNESVKCYILLRRNIVLQTISFIHAMDTKIWHVYKSDNSLDLHNLEVSHNITDQRLFEYIKNFLDQELEIFNFFSKQNIKPVIFFYEDLVSEPFTVIEQLYRDVGVYFEHKKLDYCLKEANLTTKTIKENTPSTYINFVKKYPFVEELLKLRIQNFDKQISDNLLPNIINTVQLYENNPVQNSYF